MLQSNKQTGIIGIPLSSKEYRPPFSHYKVSNPVAIFLTTKRKNYWSEFESRCL